MELKLTRIWSLNHYSNPGATAGQMPKGRLVPRHWGGVRHSISFRDQATTVTSREAAVHPLQRDLSTGRVTSSTSHCPLTHALVGAGAAGGSEPHLDLAARPSTGAGAAGHRDSNRSPPFRATSTQER